ncbi:YbjQ family protein [[Clostridium] colinum]|uniref:YbjQ family protein n=1 Tax=[Clostridium] colinum TaxID=36835 RepID=UPI002024516A|nr:YbjQ family protein [[Clostridium] colinum]
MILSTLQMLPNKNFEVLGLVEGSTVQSKHIGRDLGASFKTIVGGELKGYTEMLEEARKQATERVIEQAKALGADAVLGIHYSSSAVMQGASEILCYGTAVKFI